MHDNENLSPEEQPTPAAQNEASAENAATPAPPSALSEEERLYGRLDGGHIDVQPVAAAAKRIREEVARVVIGQESMVELLLAGILVGGHVLLEGYPGIAKTLTAKTLSRTIAVDFSRIQFTPDLMPTDITGTSVFDMKTSGFNFRKGPVFANIVLIDEINRAPAKTQAALMEVMEEKQLTYDGHTYPMAFPFFVIATQNPIEQEGTYQLPEAQLDRFIFRVRLPYPTLEEEEQILERFNNDFSTRISEGVEACADADVLADSRERIEKVFIRPELRNYIAAVVHNTRNNGDLFLGASPRASLAILKASKAIAAMRGRDFVTPDDIRLVSIPVLNHRVIISHEREMEGTTVDEIIARILSTIEVPR
jgi:MoxR-like ATPase